MNVIKRLKLVAVYLSVGIIILGLTHLAKLEAAECSSDFWMPADLRMYRGVA